MMNNVKKLSVILSIWLVGFYSYCFELKPESEFPLNPELNVSTLKNGFRFATLKNAFPKSTVEFRLIVNVGSQSDPKNFGGLAHYIEHMAFNGSKNFPLRSNIASLEEIGARFGQHFNGATFFNKTIYNISVVNTESNIELSLEVLRDIATNLTFNPEEFEKERGVIKEEVRLSTQGVEARISKQERAYRFPDSPYIEDPAGSIQSVDSITLARAIDFYRQHYIPENMTLIVTGDFPSEDFHQTIVTLFSDIKPSQTKTAEVKPTRLLPNESYAVYRDHEEVNEAVILTMPFPSIKGTPIQIDRINSHRNFFIKALKERLHQVAISNPSIFKIANAGKQERLDNSTWLYLSSRIHKENTLSAATLLYTTLLELKEFGLSDLEFTRIKDEKLDQLEAFLKIKNSIKSSRWAKEIQSYLLENGSMMSVEQTYLHDKDYLNQLELADINLQLQQIDLNDLFLEIATNDLDLSGQQVYQKIKQIKPSGIETKPQEQMTINLFEKQTQLSPVASEYYNEALSSWQWTLSNGIKVVAKKLDLEPGKIKIVGVSPNGLASVNDADYFSAKAMLGVKGRSQVKGLSAQQYTKFMNAQNIEVIQKIQSDLSYVHVKGEHENIENLLKSILLQFTSGSFDEQQLVILKNKLLAEYKKNINSDEYKFSNDINDLRYESHRSMIPWNEHTLSLLNINTMRSVYNRLFNNADGYTFFIAGDFEPKNIRNLVSGVLSQLPKSATGETNHQDNIKHVLGDRKLVVTRDNNDKALIILHYINNQEVENTLTALRLNALAGEIVRSRLMDTLREEHGLTYDVQISSSNYTQEKLSIENTISVSGLSSNVSEMIKILNAEIKHLKEFPISDDMLRSLIAKKTRDYQQEKNTMDYWINVLIDIYWHGFATEDVLEPEINLQGLTTEKLKEAINKFFSNKNRTTAVLMSKDAVDKFQKTFE